MKTYLLIIVSLFLGMQLSDAQNSSMAKKADPIVWFGIDFTKAKFVRVAETGQQLKDVLIPINNLVPSEPGKYDVAKYFKKQKVVTSLDTEQKRNDAVNVSELTVADPITLTRDDIQQVVAAYAGASDGAETGLLFVAENLDKSTQKASMYVCFFDIKTGNLIHSVKVEGKARGFGLRNYWAGAVYQIMKSWKY